MSHATINKLPESEAKRIGAAQVVIDASTAVKELLENALDAGATAVEVRLVNSGLDVLEVVDNGSGVHRNDRQLLAKKHHTSKLRTFDGVSHARSFGFRGEALFALVSSSQSVSITTKQNDDTAAETLVFAADGSIATREAAARAVGTTVTVRGLLVNVPVRRKHLERSIKREHLRVLNVVQAYALIATHARIVCTHAPSERSAKSTLLSTQASGSIRNNIITLFGAKAAASIEAVDVPLGQGGARAVGYASIASYGAGRTSNDRQFIFANGRPVDMPKLNRAANEVYRSHNSHGCPLLVLDLQIPREELDINVSPDKRTVMLQDEDAFVHAFRDALSLHYEPNRNTFAMAGPENTQRMASLTGRKRSREGEPAQVVATAHAPPRTTEAQSLQDAHQHRISPNIHQHLDGNHQNVSRLEGEEVLIRQTEDAAGDGRGNETAVNNISESHDQQSKLPMPTSRNATTEQQSKSSTLLETHERLSVGQQQVDAVNVVSTNDLRTSRQRQPVDDSQGRTSQRDKMKAAFQTILSGASARSHTFSEQQQRRPSGQESLSLTQLRMRDSQLGAEAAGTAKDRNNDNRQSGGSNATAKATKCTKETTNAPMGDRGDETHTQHASAEQAGEDNAEDGSHCLTTANNQQKELNETFEYDQEAAELDGEGAAAASIVQDHGAVRYEDVLQAQQSDLRGSDAKEKASDERLCCSLDMISSSRRNRARVREKLSVEAPSRKDRHKFRIATVMASRTSENHTEQKESNDDGDRHERIAKQTTAANSEEATSATAEAEEELKRVLSKQHFERMAVIGQFNLGFILCVHGTDVFIVDQHASDEIRNFEHLQMTTKVKKQPMVTRQPLGLSPSEEHIARSNEKVFNANGFTFADSSSTGELCLQSVPFSRNVTFGLSDVQELIALLEQQPWRDGMRTPTPSRVRSLLAMRACRSSIMVGSPLTRGKQEQIVRNLSTLSAPWNCPHGRPTLRHLLNTAKLHRSKPHRQRADKD